MEIKRSKEDNFLIAFLVVLCLYHIIARFGLAVDFQWHTDIGRDELFTPPHVMILAGMIPTSIMLVSYILWNSFVSENPNKNGFFIGPFIAPTSLWMMVCGLITLVTGGLYDDYWHISYGVDTTIITPPHIWTFAGGMLVEVATLVLALQMKNRLKEAAPKWFNLVIIGTLWALLYHFHLAFANFLEPRGWFIEIFDFKIMLHIIFAGASLIIFLPLADKLLGKNGALALCSLLLASQLLLLAIVPFLVESMMTSEHYFRPGSPHPVWAAQCLPWLLLPMFLLTKRYGVLQNPNRLVALVIVVDAVWLPTLIDYIPSEIGLFNTILSVVVSVIVLRGFVSLSQGFGAAIERLSADKIISLGKKSRSSAKMSVVGAFLLLIFTPLASGHVIHLSEDGEGLDAPKRFLIDVNETYVWVEFMIWPPKALIETEVSILPANNETSEITDAWTVLVYPTEKDTVRMRTVFEDRNNHSIWNGQVKFPFSGNQTLEVWLDVNGQSSFTEIPVDVDSPPLLPVWLAWFLAISWPTLMVLMWRNISHK